MERISSRSLIISSIPFLIPFLICTYYVQNNSCSKIISTSLRPKYSLEVKRSLDEVPEWLQYYTEWHKKQRKRKDLLTNPSIKYLSIVCHINEKCGGVSDRLTSLPYFLLFANKTERVLFIKWEKFDLEDFLLPPPGGLDWRMPPELDVGEKPDVESRDIPDLLLEEYQKDKHVHFLNYKKNLVVRSNYDLYASHFNEFTTRERPQGTFRPIMKLLFEPTPPLARMIDQTMQELNLAPRQYLSAHFRGKDVTYESKNASATTSTSIADSIDDLTRTKIHDSIQGVINISKSHNHHDNHKIYFASSNSDYVKYVLHESPFASRAIGMENVVRYHSDKPAFGYNFKESDPKDVFPAFVDLWILGESKCVSYGNLGFGKFGARLAGEDCMTKYNPW